MDDGPKDAPSAQAPPRRATVAWIVYDLANTMFSFVVLSFFFGPWMTEDLGTRDSAVLVPESLAMMVVLVLAPVLGAITDRTRRMPFLVVSTLVAVVMTMLIGVGDLLGLGQAGTVALAMLFFFLANIGYQLGLVFYDALLPAVSTPQNVGRVGSWGVGIGYIGSFIGLAAGAVIVGLGMGGEPVLFIATGILFLLFAIPCFVFVRERRGKGAVPKGIVRATARDVVGRVRSIPRRYPKLGRFLIARVLYADAVNTLLLILGIYAVGEAGFEKGTTPYFLLLGLGILFAVLTAPLWGILVDRAGARHTLRLVLLVWALCLALVAVHPMLGLPRDVFFLYGVLVGIGLAGTWSSDRPLLVHMAPKDEVGGWFGLYALAGRFAAIVGPLMYAFTVDVAFRDHPRARSIGVLVLLVQIVLSWLVLRRLPDPTHPGKGPMARLVPWGQGGGRRLEGARALPWFIFAYLIVSWLVFLPLAEPQDGVLVIPREAREGLDFSIPDLSREPILVYASLATAPFINHDSVQLIYVTILLVLFGIAFEMKEGIGRFALVFFGTTFVGAVFAGVLLHLVYPEVSTHPVLEQAWRRTWSGGSVGAFGVMGALAARARTPWPLLGFFVFWEVNVGWWYLRSYTPAFHLSALVAGFLFSRLRWPRVGGTKEARAGAGADGSSAGPQERS